MVKIFDALSKTSHRLIESRLIKSTLISVGIITSLAALMVLGHDLAYSQRVYPNIHLQNQNLSNRTFVEVDQLVANKIADLKAHDVTFVSGEKEHKVSWKELGISLDVTPTQQLIKRYGRQGGFFDNAGQIASLLWRPVMLEPIVSWTPGPELDAYLEQLRQEYNHPEQDATLQITDGGIRIEPEASGTRLDESSIKTALQADLQSFIAPVIELKFEAIKPKVTAAELELLREKAENWRQQNIVFVYELTRWHIGPNQISSWISSAFSSEGESVLTTNTTEARHYLFQKAEEGIHREPVNAVFEMADGKVTRFEPSLDGVVIDLDQTLANLDDALSAGVSDVAVAVARTEPEVTTAKVNDWGITELVARGVSYYTGSSAARVANIRTGSRLLDGTIIMPGEVFSFNNTVGRITADAGFVEGLIISGGATVPGLGGGICQVSTTMFRAALDGGYPIEERHPHSYRVTYYEIGGPGFEVAKPGIDAAVFSPAKDFKFRNDTPYGILIRTHVNAAANQMIYELYSTRTDREVTISEPNVYNLRSAPPPVYFDKPDKPVGYLKQVDWAVAGAETEFTRTVRYPDGTERVDRFYSNFRPWSAKYERGTMGAKPEEDKTTEASVEQAARQV